MEDGASFSDYEDDPAVQGDMTAVDYQRVFPIQIERAERFIRDQVQTVAPEHIRLNAEALVHVFQQDGGWEDIDKVTAGRGTFFDQAAVASRPFILTAV